MTTTLAVPGPNPAAPAAGTTPAVRPDGATPTAVPGLLLRPVRWPEDARTLAEINNASRRAGGSIFLLTPESFHAFYENLQHCDPATDLRIGESEGRPVAYVRVEWNDEHRGDRAFAAPIFWTPDAPDGTFAALVDWALARHRAIAPTLAPTDRPLRSVLTTWRDDADVAATLEERGFAPVRFGYEMVRPTLDDIPDLPLPDGIEVRPAEPAHRRAIFEAEVDAFAGHWGAGPDDGSEIRWRAFEDDPFNEDLALWQVAWAGHEIVGMVRPFVNEEENAQLGVRRGWCENISTRAAWRGRGVASALICRALGALRERGMTEAALGVDAQNETGALRLYEKMGFRPVFREVEWRRPLAVEPVADAGRHVAEAGR